MLRLIVLALLPAPQVTAASTCKVALADSGSIDAVPHVPHGIPTDQLQAMHGDQKARMAAFRMMSETEMAATALAQLHVEKSDLQAHEVAGKACLAPEESAAWRELSRIYRCRFDPSLLPRLPARAGQVTH